MVRWASECELFGRPMTASAGAFPLLAEITDRESVCRYGGEEFCVVMRDTSIENRVTRWDQIESAAEGGRGRPTE